MTVRFLCLLCFCLCAFNCLTFILHDYSDNWLWQICADVSSPVSVEAAGVEHVLPFVRVAALLQFHVFHDVLPSLSTLVWLINQGSHAS